MLDDFRLEAVLGRGGMGIVYRARQPALDRYAAVKVISAKHAGDATFRERFLRETRNAARVEHPHVVPVYQAGEARGQLYLAMRLVEGPDLKTLLAAEGPFEPDRAVHVVSQLADALAAAHAKGLVHRDVKPRNVLVATASGVDHAYLADFGLARRPQGDGSRTADGLGAGTLDYMAPEVLRGASAGTAADTYSLGCLLYELLMNRVPFPCDNDAGKVAAHLLRRPPRVVTADPAAAMLDGVVQRAMAKCPGDRYRSTADLADDARRALQADPKRSVARGPCRARRPPVAATRGHDSADAISELLNREDVRLVTMTDPRGVAETRLAIVSQQRAPGISTPHGRVLLVLDTIDPLAALRAVAAPPESPTVTCERAVRHG